MSLCAAWNIYPRSAPGSVRYAFAYRDAMAWDLEGSPPYGGTVEYTLRLLERGVNIGHLSAREDASAKNLEYRYRRSVSV